MNGDAFTDEHVMISYNWNPPAKDIMLEIKWQLERRGYNVWMDVDRMEGNMYTTMAEAIRNSFVVLACITPGYQNSANCQREMSMACDEKKPIVPIKVSNFRERGWLQAAIAGQLYYTIEGVEQVAQELPKIIREIERARNTGQLSLLPPSPSTAHALPTQFRSSSASETLPEEKFRRQLSLESPSPTSVHARSNRFTFSSFGESLQEISEKRVQVSERQLNKLARNFPGDEGSYLDLCAELDIGSNEAMNIYNQKLRDFGAAVRACLQKYRNRTGGYQHDLVRILEAIDLGHLQTYIR